MGMKKVYLDYAATTPLDKEVLAAMQPYFGEMFGNPDSLHSFGREAAYAVTCARDMVAQTLGAEPREVYFTSGGTEADNWAVRCLRGGEGVALVSAIEHAAVLSATQLRIGGRERIPVTRDGIVSAEAVADCLNEKTALVCVMAVNNETGAVQPIEEIAALCRARGIPLFCDCVQAGNACDLKALWRQCDAIALSGHKLYGPKGVGALVVKKRERIVPLLAGGEQERGLRGGTLDVAGIVGFSVALEKAQRERENFCAHTLRLRDLFEERVLSALGSQAVRNGTDRIASISHLTFRSGGEALLNALDLSGVACSGGAACSAHAALPSHVLLAMGRSEEEARKGIRFSFGKFTGEEETLFAAERTIACALRMGI